MTTLSGNICLVLAALLTSTSISMIFNYKPPHGGAGGVEAYPIWILVSHFIFLCLLAIACIAISMKGGFDWISPYKLFRYPLVAIGLLLTVYIATMSAMMMHQSGSIPFLLQKIVQYAFVSIPIILIASGFVLLNDTLRELVPVACYKWPLAALFGLGLWMAGMGVYEIATADSRRAAELQQYENSEFIKASRLREIEESDVTTSMVRILEFTRAFYPLEVREKAAEKIRSHPTWQQALLNLLEDDHALEVFGFLASNEVPDKKRFLKPVQTGVFASADWIRHTIQGTSPSGFTSDLFSDETERVLRTVEKFEGMGTDYLPAVRAYRAAFDEPSAAGKVKLNCIVTVDEWLKKHQ
jgi:hypothetical protein